MQCEKDRVMSAEFFLRRFEGSFCRQPLSLAQHLEVWTSAASFGLRRELDGRVLFTCFLRLTAMFALRLRAVVQRSDLASQRVDVCTLR